MTQLDRVEELAAIALDEDRGLTEEEWFELEALLADEEAWEAYRRFLDTEVVLRGMDRKVDLADRVLAEIENDRGSSILGFPSARRPILGAAAAVLVVGIVGWILQSRSGVEIPQLASQVGQVETVKDGNYIFVRVSKNSRAVWNFDDATSIGIESDSQLILGAELAKASAKSKQIELISGTLKADVAKQEPDHPLLVETPHARAVVRGTRFEITTFDTTRLVVTEGQVDLIDGLGETLEVRAGEVGVAGPDGLRKSVPRASGKPVILFTFENGQGESVPNRSSLGDSFDLFSTVSGQPLKWREDGIRFDGESFLVTRETAGPIVDLCRASNEVTFEVWITPAVASQGGPARILTLTRGSTPNGIMLAQGAYQVLPATGFLGRTPTDAPGGDRRRPLSVDLSPERLTHLVYTHSADGLRRLFVDGQEVSSDRLEGGFGNWPGQFPLSVGGDLEGENRGGQPRAWKGTMHFLAVFDRALSSEEVEQNFAAGSRQYRPVIRFD